MTSEEMSDAFGLVTDMKRIATYGWYTGRLETPEQVKYWRRCRRDFVSFPIQTRLLFTRDVEMHACGWWKNPDYSQCLHLSVSFVDVEAGVNTPKNKALTDLWVDLFFGDWKRLLWAEPPFSPDGKKVDVWHYRVFTSPDFGVPILPRGEVYSKELTERGWQSWSDLHDGEKQETAHT